LVAISKLKILNILINNRTGVRWKSCTKCSSRRC